MAGPSGGGLARPPARKAARGARERLPLRHHLFHGGLPAQLLDAVRLLCAPTDEAAAALCDAFEKRAPQFIDWNAIDWAADDDAAAEPEVADPPVQSAADEANARARLAAAARKLRPEAPEGHFLEQLILDCAGWYYTERPTFKAIVAASSPWIGIVWPGTNAWGW